MTVTGILDQLGWPAEWQAIPFGRLADRRKDTGRADSPPLSVFLDKGVVPRASRNDNYNRLGADLSQYLVVQPGDLVFNKLRTWQGGIGVSDYTGIVSPAYFACRPRPGLFPRFAHYTLRSSPYLQELTRVSKWMPPAQFDIAWEDLREVVVRVPPLSVQRAIADYLDVVTARIDSGVDARLQQSNVLGERLGSCLADLWERDGLVQPATDIKVLRRQLPEGWQAMSLNRVLLRMTNGYVGPTRDILRDAGVPYVQSVNIKGGRIALARKPYFVDQSWHDAHPRTALRVDDILVVQTGDVGQVAMVGRDLGSANCHALLILRVDKRYLKPRYLYWFLRSHYGYQALLSRATGALHPHLEAGEIGSVPVVVPPIRTQELFCNVLERQALALDEVRGLLDRQVQLMRERREALITAAVTGQLTLDRGGVAA